MDDSEVRSSRTKCEYCISIQSQSLSTLRNKTLYRFLRRNTHTKKHQNWLFSNSTLSWIFTPLAFIFDFTVTEMYWTGEEYNDICHLNSSVVYRKKERKMDLAQYDQIGFLDYSSDESWTSTYTPQNPTSCHGGINPQTDYEICIERLPHTCIFHVYK